MNWMSWNCRGAGSKGFSSLMNDVIKEYDVGVLCLLETHINGRRAKQVASRIKLDGVHIVDAHGQAGGIWYLWDSKKWDLAIVTQSSQFIHIKVRCGDSHWFCTFVYASPHPQFCIDLWRELCSLASGIDRPWALMGDFNAVLKNFERSNSSGSRSHRGDKAFCDFVQQNNLIDIGFQGSPYTWRRGSLFERLDRVLASYEWRMDFPEAEVTHLNPLKLDHVPVLLKLKNQRTLNSTRRPFRFEAAWLTHVNFKEVVKQSWRINGSWNDRVQHIQKACLDWNRSVFGNVFFQKRKLLRRLHGISRTLYSGPNKFLENLQTKLWQELEMVLHREEVIWFQKSRCKWLTMGDRNTRFFHGSTIVRRRKNRITKIINDEGEWITEQPELESFVTGFYKELFHDP
ncbi:uncharacterized protein LOC109796303 [Cajanus cajan]|uniref:uncharacterized protein LOC109796303 n=1 Tax=Cajanus cajan TaxID=3821 RepID=UPI00098D850A|nr:uncharacterized protein LOC109796303 [Cajanus cajan]